MSGSNSPTVRSTIDTTVGGYGSDSRSSCRSVREQNVLKTVLEEISRSEHHSNVVEEDTVATDLLRNFYLDEMKKENWKESIIEMGNDILSKLLEDNEKIEDNNSDSKANNDCKQSSDSKNNSDSKGNNKESKERRESITSPNKWDRATPLDTTYIMYCKDLNKSIELKAGCMYLIGRSSECDLQLTEYGISRLHALIFVTINKTIIIDFWSQMGTRLSNLKLDDNIEEIKVVAASTPKQGRKALILNRTDSFVIEFLNTSKIYKVRFSNI